MTIHGTAALSLGTDTDAQTQWSISFKCEGVIGPTRLFAAEQCRLFSDHLRKASPPPVDWAKGRAVSDRAFYELASRPDLLTLLRPLLGHNIVLWGARVIERKPGQAHAWHTDIESSAPEGRFASVWIGLENTSQASALQLITRSHAFGKSIQQVWHEKGVTRSDASAERVFAWAKEIDPEAEFVQPEMSDGEALIFDGRLWHGSFNSRRSGTRLALLLQYAESGTPVRIPDSKQLEWPFRFLDNPLPPVILVSGASAVGVNRIVPPPQADAKRVSLLSSMVHPLPLPLREDMEKRWRPHRIFRGNTPILDFMGCHASILSAGHMPHQPHAHAEEELLIPLAGEAEVIISDGPEVEGARVERVRPGGFVYYPPYQHHTIRNPGESPITYLMFKWRAGASRERQTLATSIFWYGDFSPDGQKPRSGHRLFREPTPSLSKLSSHVTVLQAGAGYEPHVDPYDVAILLLSGTVSTLGQTVTAPGVVYYPAGEPHGMKNVGDAAARYLVFEFHPSKARASLWASIVRSLQGHALVEGGKRLLQRKHQRRLVKTGRQFAKRATKLAAKTPKRLQKGARRAIRQALPQRRIAKARRQLAKRSRRYIRTRSGLVKFHGRFLSRMNSVRRHFSDQGFADTGRLAAKRMANLVLRAHAPAEERCRREQAEKKKLHAEKERQPSTKDRARIDSAVRRVRKHRCAGNFTMALAICDGLPGRLHECTEILQERGILLQRLGELNAAYDLFIKVLRLDPKQGAAWKYAGMILVDLDRSDELPAFIEDMLSALPRRSETLMLAAWIAGRGRHHDIADRLFEQALSPAYKPSADTILKAARTLLKAGEQGRIIKLLERAPAAPNSDLQNLALDLRGLARAQLRLAGGSALSAPVGETDRADVTAFKSIIEQRNLALARPKGQGIAIVLSTLGPGGISRQVVRLVRELCRMPDGRVGPISLLLVSHSDLAPEFYGGELAGLNVSVERIADFDVELGQLVPQALAGKLSVLPSKIVTRTAFLIDRFASHYPKVVLAMGESIGLAAMLAASIVDVPRVVVSGRGEPPPARGLRDSFLRQAYQAALSRNRVSFAAISAATARNYASWLEQPPERVKRIYNGIDVDELLSQRNLSVTAEHRRALGIPDKARVIGSIFNDRREKRRRLWIEAAAIIARRSPDIAFVLVGGRHERNDVCTTLRRYGLDGRFHRPGVRKDVVTWLDMMDVVLLTSESEAAPNVLIEAQALGRPVVATAVGGNAETFLPGQTGILLPANPSAEEVADAVMRVLDDPAFAARVRDLAPPFIRQRFDTGRMGREFVDLCFGDVDDLDPRSYEEAGCKDSRNVARAANYAR